MSRRGERRGRWRWGLAGHAGPGQLSRCPHVAPRPCSRAARVESEGYPIQRAVSCIQSDSTRSGLPQLRETMTQRASEEDSSSAPVIPSGMKNDCGGYCAPSTSGRREMGTAPLPPPSVPSQNGACRVGARPLPRPPSAGGGDRGSGTRPPPLAVVTSEHRRHRGGPAGREREERRGEVRSEPAGTGKRSERAASRAPGRGPAAAPRSGEVRAASRAVPRRRRRTQA